MTYDDVRDYHMKFKLYLHINTMMLKFKIWSQYTNRIVVIGRNKICNFLELLKNVYITNERIDYRLYYIKKCEKRKLVQHTYHSTLVG